MYNTPYGFIKQIQKEKNKDTKFNMILALTDSQFKVVKYIYDKHKLPFTKLEFKEIIQDEGVDHYTGLNSLTDIIDYSYSPNCDKKELAKSIIVYLAYIDSAIGWKSCRGVSKIIFKEARLGIKRREIRRAEKERIIKKTAEKYLTLNIK